MSPSDVRSYTYKVSPTRMPKHEQSKDNTNEYARRDEEKTGPQLNTRNYRQLRKAGGGHVGFPREKHSYCLFSAKQPALKACIQVTLDGLKGYT